jgi:hypothetical protein
VVDEAQSSSTGEEEASSPIPPSKTSKKGREDEAHEDDQVEVPLLLPSHDGGLRQVRDVGRSDGSAGLDEHPADVRVEEASMSVVGVEIGVAVEISKMVVQVSKSRWGKSRRKRTDVYRWCAR